MIWICYTISFCVGLAFKMTKCVLRNGIRSWEGLPSCGSSGLNTEWDNGRTCLAVCVCSWVYLCVFGTYIHTYVFECLPYHKKKDVCLSLDDLFTHTILNLQLRSEGKDYIVQEGDVMLFRFNV